MDVRAKRRVAVAAAIAIVAVVALGFMLRPDRGHIPDGEWELVATNFEDDIELRPLFLSSKDGRLSGDNGCNDFGEQPNGDMVQTLVGCLDDRAELETRVMHAVMGSRSMDGDLLVLKGGGFGLEYAQVVPAFPEMVLNLLASDEPRVDPATVFFDPEGGQANFDLLPIESGHPTIDMYVGQSERLVCYYYVAEPITSGSSCLHARDFARSGLRINAAGRDGPLGYRAVILPDDFVDSTTTAQLETLGVVLGNLVKIDAGTAGGTYVLTNDAGDELPIVVPTAG